MYFFSGVVISLLYESLMLAWLCEAVAGQWLTVVSKGIACGNALTRVNRNARPLDTDCITCKTSKDQNANLLHFKALTVIVREKKSRFQLSGLMDKPPPFGVWRLLIVNSGHYCCQNKSGYCGNLCSYPWYPCFLIMAYGTEETRFKIMQEASLNFKWQFPCFILMWPLCLA